MHIQNEWTDNCGLWMLFRHCLLVMTMVCVGYQPAVSDELNGSTRQTVRLSHPQFIVLQDDTIPAQTGKLAFVIEIDGSGNVITVQLAATSGDKQLDEMIRNIVQKWHVDLEDAPREQRSRVSISYEVKPLRTVIVRGSNNQKVDIDQDRHVEVVNAKQLSERIVSSTPDALTFASGVFVQRTAHGQASPYIRGRTGQQTLLLFDGLRLNHALFRKGPNQYLFTIDPQTLSSIEVLRGSAGVEFGGDAIGGAIFLHPKDPRIDPTLKGSRISGRSMMQVRSADSSTLLRTEMALQANRNWAFSVGVGGGVAKELEAGGRSIAKEGAQDLFCDSILSVPCFRKDGRTQVGTGYKHVTADLRTKMKRGAETFTSALYLYRQYEAPRTDQCPAPEAPIGECLMIDEQFRTHGYLKYDRRTQLSLAETVTMSVSFQRQHQQYQLTRPDRNANDNIDTTTRNGGTDQVDGFSGFVRSRIQSVGLGSAILDARYGVDMSTELIASDTYIEFAQPPTRVELSRGQYVNGSQYHQGGVYLAPSVRWQQWRVRGGIRQAMVRATSDGETESSSLPFDHTFTPLVWNVGLSWGGSVQVFGSLEQGFRAPNLDDLTARQSTGQGYQLENPDLRPEIATTAELGIKLNTSRIKGSLFVYHQALEDAMERRLLTRDECTLSNGYTDRACRSNRAPLQLINLPGIATVKGAEAELRIRLATHLALRLGAGYAHGEGPHPNPEIGEQAPLSRIPPLNGTSELIWRRSGFYLTAATRWATRQDRLSIGDIADARIPNGGTPGYGVYDLRMGLRMSHRTYVNAVLENMTDERYRSHGSGVFGAGRSLNLQVSIDY